VYVAVRRGVLVGRWEEDLIGVHQVVHEEEDLRRLGVETDPHQFLESRRCLLLTQMQRHRVPVRTPNVNSYFLIFGNLLGLP